MCTLTWFYQKFCIMSATFQNFHLKWRDAYLKKNLIAMAITALLLVVSNL